MQPFLLLGLQCKISLAFLFCEVQQNDSDSNEINYVLSTRFTLAQGYLVESRRGGGGFVRIVCLTFDGDEDLKQVLTETIGEEISQNEAEGLLESLLSQGYLEDRESLILKTMLKDRVIGGDKKSRDTLRANLLKHALSAICQ